jgi:hypothetical protein
LQRADLFRGLCPEVNPLMKNTVEEISAIRDFARKTSEKAF